MDHREGSNDLNNATPDIVNGQNAYQTEEAQANQRILQNQADLLQELRSLNDSVRRWTDHCSPPDVVLALVQEAVNNLRARLMEIQCRVQGSAVHVELEQGAYGEIDLVPVRVPQ